MFLVSGTYTLYTASELQQLSSMSSLQGALPLEAAGSQKHVLCNWFCIENAV